MVVKIRNDDNVTCWVHRTQLRFIPDRPEHLRKSVPLMIPVPVTTQLPPQIPQQPTGGRPSQRVGSSVNRRSKIPISIDRNRSIQTEKATNSTRIATVAPTEIRNTTKNADGDLKLVVDTLENEHINKSNFILTYDEIFVSPWAANISYEMEHRKIVQVITFLVVHCAL